MNHLDPIEKRFKDSLEAFEDVAPSEGLYQRIEGSLLKRKLARMFNWKIGLLLLVLFLGVSWTGYSLFRIEAKREIAQRNKCYINHYQKVKDRNCYRSNYSEDSESTKAQTSFEALTSEMNIPNTTDVSPEIVPVRKVTSPSSIVNSKAKAKLLPAFIPKKETSENANTSDYRLHFLSLRGASLLATQNDLLSLQDVRNKFVKQKRPRFSSEYFIGVGIAQSRLESKNAEWNEHVAFQERNENANYTPLLGMHISYHHRDWFIKSGVQYTTLSDDVMLEMDKLYMEEYQTKMRFVNNVYKDSITGYVNTPVGLLPVITQVLDTTIITETISTYQDSVYRAQYVNYTNTLSYIEIPLLLGREFSWRTWKLDVAGGIGYSMLVQQQFQYPDKDMLNLTDYTSQTNIVRKHMFSAQVAVGLGYQISTQSTVFIRPSYHYQLSSIFNKDFALQKRYQMIRLSAGLRFKL